MSQNNTNRRHNIRFKTRIPEVIKLKFRNQTGYEDVEIPAIKVDENIKCMSCILVSPFELTKGAEIHYCEADDYLSNSKIIRVNEIEATVYRVVIEYMDQ